jgi:UDP-N-acetylglucosamine:LPS N-acetylglucosamine transferase
MAQELLPTLRSLFHDSSRLAAMREQARTLARPDGAWCLAQELLRLGEGQA